MTIVEQPNVEEPVVDKVTVKNETPYIPVADKPQRTILPGHSPSGSCVAVDTTNTNKRLEFMICIHFNVNEVKLKEEIQEDIGNKTCCCWHLVKS